MQVPTMSSSISHLGTMSVCAIIIIIAAGGAYLASAMPASSSSSSSYSVTAGNDSSSLTSSSTSMTTAIFATKTSETTNSTLGLKLVLSVNATLLQSGQAVNVTASIFNTLPTENNVSGANDWAIPSLASDASFPCPTYLYYQVYQGWYSRANISESGIMPLQVAPVYQYLSCPIFQRSYYLFQPYSDIASVPVGYFVTNSSVVYQPTEMAVSSSLVGNYSSGVQCFHLYS